MSGRRWFWAILSLSYPFVDRAARQVLTFMEKRGTRDLRLGMGTTPAEFPWPLAAY